MTPQRLNEEQYIAKLKQDIADREAKLAAKEEERKARLVKRIEAKEEQIKKLDAEILKLHEEIGIDVPDTAEGAEVKTKAKDKQDAQS